MPKAYLGDGVYANIDERGIILTAENGIIATDTIVLEPEVWDALLAYVMRHLQAIGQGDVPIHRLSGVRR